jgi:hypothetical protein
LGGEHPLLVSGAARAPEAETDDTDVRVARMNDAIAPQSMTAPIVEKA